MGELEQLIAALEAYLALGEDTPVAQEAAALLAAATASQGGEEGMPPEGGVPPMEEMPVEGDMPPEEMDLGALGAEDPMAVQEGEPPAASGAKTFGEANKSALPRLEERNKKKRDKAA